MRCEEKIGFLMLRRCETPAETQCSMCGKKLCSEHTFALSPEQIAMLSTKPASQRVIACLECLHKNQPQKTSQSVPQASQATRQGQTNSGRHLRDTDYDPYYRYPYYGSYHPYIWGTTYSDQDRRIFDRQEAHTGDHASDSTLDS